MVKFSLRFTVLLLACEMMIATGCSSKLETGYEPRRLAVTPAERRGYYASPFTPEAAMSAREANADSQGLRRPGMYR